MLLTGFFTTLTFVVSVAQVKPGTAAERQAGLKKRQILQENLLLKNIKFRNIGPSIMSGRVVDIDVNPNDATEFYVAYATGGLWHTTNNGQSFVPIFDKEDVLGIGDIAVNWQTREIWVGTGEANSSRSSYAGIGIYKSADNGATWQYLGLPESQHIGKILLNPSNKNIAWVAVLGHLYSPNKERGVYKTTDGGKTWKQTLYIDENTGAIEMDINPKNSDELYACMWHRERRAWNFVESGATSGIYKSIDGGEKWKLITQAGSGFPSGNKQGRMGIAVYANNPNILYATVDNNDHRPDTAKKRVDSNSYSLKEMKNISVEDFLLLDKKKLDSFFIKNNFDKKYRDSSVKELVRTGVIKPDAVYNYLFDANTALFDTPIIGCEVYRSDDAGITWRKVNTRGLDLYNTYGYYFGKLSLSPVNENKVVINGFVLMLSNDGGKTFKAVDKPSTHPDWHGCWINPLKDSNWIAANDGGCNITYDNGKHWFKANTPAVGQFYAIDVDDAKPYNVYGGIQDNGVWYGPSDNIAGDQFHYSSPDPWKNLGGGDGMQVQVDRRDNKTVYSGSQFGYYSRQNRDYAGDNNDGITESPDESGRPGYPEADDKKPLNIHPKNDLQDPPLRYNWQTPVMLSRYNQDIFYMGSNRVYRSMNKGENMQPLSIDLTKGKKEGNVPYGTITTLSESPIRFGLLYCGTDDGNIQVSKDGGYTWTLVSRNLPQNLYVSRVQASEYKEGRVYATLNAYRNDNFNPWLFVSNDYGVSWSALGSNLPDGSLNVVREDPKKEDIIYVGSDNGLYVSFDMGKTFMSMSQSLPPVPVHDIAIQKTANEIVIGTHGRSIYIASLQEVWKIYEQSKKH